ncbi:sugar phosphate isomerase/epimerase family protein [Komagataeibacter medellinensis]|uniref:Xylose isomerase domain protein n=1 Tax=Komagataeibacter medellinensis (strain NBRC 3288 / BCRC 11682 / LMG 1693 / Kondo 51) TaxID=634177 RepID=G2I307_KOMMN|nr:sugar phosphate isomerase/epimerase [Komagataeibacter medellinensis]BAK82612.1 xylose isomerase domain protein [Komagataeibacter medellinensis NBRC 3288]
MKIGTDLVTFYNPAFWRLTTQADITNLARADGRAFWTRILDSLHEAGITGIEMTFPPFDQMGAVAAFGSEASLKHELGIRGLEVWSCFFAALDRMPAGHYASTESQILTEVDAAARFLCAMGGSVLVVGLPCRQTFLSTPSAFIDLAFAAPLCGLLNRMGFAAARHSITLAIHTESHTVACAPRDVDLFMLLTDPRYVSLCPDPAHIILEGGDPVALITRHRERVVAMHWKDATRAMPVDTPIDTDIHTRHRAFFCELGDGRANFGQLAAQLGHAPLRCGPILELDACAQPVPVLRRGIAFIRDLTERRTP